jgi:hypothetical protein
VELRTQTDALARRKRTSNAGARQASEECQRASLRCPACFLPRDFAAKDFTGTLTRLVRKLMSETPSTGPGSDLENSEPHREHFLRITGQLPPFTPRQWRVFWISTTAGFFENYDTALLSLALKQIQQGLGIAEAHLGAMLSAIRLGYLASLTISPLADVFDRRRLLLYTIVGYTVFTGLSAIAPHQRSFTASQCLARAFSGAEATVSLVILVEEVDAAVRGWAVGLQGAFSISGYGLAAMVFALIGIFPFGWRGLYALALLPLGLIISRPTSYGG